MSREKPATRNVTSSKFGGSPAQLQEIAPSTYRNVIQCYYFIVHTNKSFTTKKTCNMIVAKLQEVWESINPNLPLLTEIRQYNKVKELCGLVKQINRKHASATKKKNLELKLDSLFDISSCCCELPIRPCFDFMVKCSIKDGQTEHIVCLCGAMAGITLEDRAYLRDHKLGNFSKYQLGQIDRKFVNKVTPGERVMKHIIPDATYETDMSSSDEHTSSMVSSITYSE